MLASAGQGNEAVTYAVKARDELQAELRKLTAGTWPLAPPHA